MITESATAPRKATAAFFMHAQRMSITCVDIHAGDVQEITAVKDDAERDLAQAQPALDAALVALNSITPKDISGLKALKNPPDVVKRIFDCVLLLRCASIGFCFRDCKRATGSAYTS